MFSTVAFIIVFVGLLFASAVLWALFLRLGLRWAKTPDVTTCRIIVTTAIVIVLQTALNLFASSYSVVPYGLLSVLALASAVMVPCIVICTVFRIRFLRSIQAWLPTLLATFTVLVFVFLVLRPFLYESFVNSSNTMAPTLLGQHWIGTCPDCTMPNYCSPTNDRFGTAHPPQMICSNFHVNEVADISKTAHRGDRFLVAKFLTPRRWDIVIFQFPEDPAILYVKRLIGLPGEKIHIQDGSLWVDDERQTPPDALQGIEYLSELPIVGPILSGSVNRPALLGNEEYFVLGDFSSQSSDSRLWERGAPGYNQYAVPKSYIKGVVTHTFWPLDRWRIHR